MIIEIPDKSSWIFLDDLKIQYTKLCDLNNSRFLTLVSFTFVQNLQNNYSSKLNICSTTMKTDSPEFSDAKLKLFHN